MKMAKRIENLPPYLFVEITKKIADKLLTMDHNKKIDFLQLYIDNLKKKPKLTAAQKKALNKMLLSIIRELL